MAGKIQSAKLEGNKLTVVIELDPKGEPSSSGKMFLNYTSGGWGNVPVEPNSTIGQQLRWNLSIGTYANRR